VSRRNAAGGLGYALAAAVFFGGAGPVAKALIGAGLSPLETVWLRLAGAALVLVPAVALVRRDAVRALLRGRGRLVLLYGVFAIAAVQALYFVAVSRLPVGVALLIEYTAPVLVIGWVRLVRRTSLPGLAYAGAAAAVLGLGCVVQVWSGLRLDAVGLAAALGAAACQASFFLLSDRLTVDGDPLALTACGAAVATVALGVLAQPWNLPWHVLAGPVLLAGHPVPAPLLLAWLAVVATVLAYATGIAAIERLSAPVAGVIASTEVVVAALLAWLVLGERLTPIQLLGGTIVLAGALTTQRATTPTAAPPTLAPPDLAAAA
jgi:drug/metabolite transporter (DMT)-like permease